MSFSRPLGLHKHLTRPGQHLEVVPLFDVLLIALMLTLLGSRFVSAPGLSVDLPVADAPVADAVAVSPTVAVLTLLKDNSLIYGGRLLSVENFEREVTMNPLPERVADTATDGLPPRVLLIKGDAHVSLGTMLKVMNAARKAGYDRIQIAEQINRADQLRTTVPVSRP